MTSDQKTKPPVGPEDDEHEGGGHDDRKPTTTHRPLAQRVAT
jgi:hypothetical protein